MNQPVYSIASTYESTYTFPNSQINQSIHVIALTILKSICVFSDILNRVTFSRSISPNYIPLTLRDMFAKFELKDTKNTRHLEKFSFGNWDIKIRRSYSRVKRKPSKPNES